VAVISRAAAGTRAAVVAGAGTSSVIERVRQRARMAEGGEKRGRRRITWTPLARSLRRVIPRQHLSVPWTDNTRSLPQIRMLPLPSESVSFD
jgi:hypothetical protein